MAEQFHRYCQHCGARFDTRLPFCPSCVQRWQPSELPIDRTTTKALLETDEGRISLPNVVLLNEVVRLPAGDEGVTGDDAQVDEQEQEEAGE